MALLVTAASGCGGPSLTIPESRPTKRPAAPAAFAPLDLRDATLATLVLPRPREALSRLSGYARPLRSLPLLGRAFSPAGLRRSLFRGLGPSLDLARPVALALLDERRSRRFDWRQQLVVALPLRDAKGFVVALKRRYPQVKELGPGRARFTDPRRSSRLWLQISKGWALLASRPRLHRGASSVLRPLLDAPPRELRLVLHAERVAKSFPTARGFAAALLRARVRGGGALRRLASQALGLPTLAAVVTELQGVELELALRKDGVHAAATLRGGARLSRLLRAPAVGRPWGVELLPVSLPLLVTSHEGRLERERALTSLLAIIAPGVAARAKLRGLASALVAALGPAQASAYGAPGGVLAAAGVATVTQPLKARRSLDALATLLAQRLPSWLAGRSRPRARVARFRVGGARFASISVALPAASKARRALLGRRPCVAFGVVKGGPQRRRAALLWAVGPRCRIEARALAKFYRATKKAAGSRVVRALRAQLGGATVSQGVALSLAGTARQAIPIAAARGALSMQTGALARMLVPPPGSPRAMVVVGRWRPVGATLRARLHLPLDVLEFGAQVAALMFRIGSYGGRR